MRSKEEAAQSSDEEEYSLDHEQLYLNPHLSTNRGWEEQEEEVLSYLIRMYGIGCWANIRDTGFLPGKTKSQIVDKVKKKLGGWK